eukprot:g6292.t1
MSLNANTFDPNLAQDEPIAVPHYEWPADDPITHSYESAAVHWRRVHAPMLERLNFSYRGDSTAPASNYVKDAPKIFCRLWQHRAEPTRLEGAVFFTPAASGPPACAHGGALFAALDIMLSAALFFYPEAGLPFTASLRVEYRRFVPLRPGVVRFRLERVVRDPVRLNRLSVRASLSSPHASLRTAAGVGEQEVVHCAADGVFSVPKEGTPPASVDFVRAARLINEQPTGGGSAWRAPPVAVHRLPAAALGEGARRAARGAVAGFVARAERGELEDFDFLGDFPAFFASQSVASVADASPRNRRAFVPLGYPQGTSMFEFSAAAKIRTRLWWGGGAGVMHGLVWFTQHTEGPPRRVHGGAVATAFDGALGGTVIRAVGLGANTTALSVEYLRAVPVGAVADGGDTGSSRRAREALLGPRYVGADGQLRDPVQEALSEARRNPTCSVGSAASSSHGDGGGSRGVVRRRAPELQELELANRAESPSKGRRTAAAKGKGRDARTKKKKAKKWRFKPWVRWTFGLLLSAAMLLVGWKLRGSLEGAPVGS